MNSIKSNDYNDDEGKLPVFVFPASLSFYIDDQSSHKQVLTLYNPYEFVVQFQVLCNNPSQYNVVESEGLIKQKCCIDIVIRAINLTKEHINKEDKFRIRLYEHGLKKLLGKKDISAILFPSKCREGKHQPDKRRRTSSREIDEFHMKHYRRESVVLQRSLPSIPVIIVSLLCVIVLMLPTDGDPGSVYSRVPDYLHVSVNQKLIAAYVLGLVTMAILKTSN